MDVRFVAFDLEIANEFPDDGNIDHSKLGISCAATLYHLRTNDLVTHWYDFNTENGVLGPRMTPLQCQALVNYLSRNVRHGALLVTWNGHFDMQVLAHECQDAKYFAECQDLALKMYDPMFQFLTQEGYCVALEKVSLGMGGEAKAEGIHGADAPVLWKQGREAQDRVLSYVQGDVEITAAVFQKIVEQKRICRYTQKGKWRSTNLDKIMSVEECLGIPQEPAVWFKNNPWKIGGGQDRDAIAAWCLEG